MPFDRVNSDDLTREQRAKLQEMATNVQGLDPDSLTNEQAKQLLQLEHARELKQAEETMNTLHDLVNAEVRRQNEFIESNLWETDWTEVHTVDVVTIHPYQTSPGEFKRPDIQVYRYGNEEEVPEAKKYDRRDARVTLQRLDYDLWIEMVEELDNAGRIPEDVSIITGSKGVSDDRDSLSEGGDE